MVGRVVVRLVERLHLRHAVDVKRVEVDIGLRDDIYRRRAARDLCNLVGRTAKRDGIRL